MELIWFENSKKKKHALTTKWQTNRWTLAIGHTVVELTKNLNSYAFKRVYYRKYDSHI